MSAAESLQTLLSASPGLAAALPGIERAAASEAPVLILGESGCGCSRLARCLHAASRRRAGALVEVDPGALPATLLESELYGHQVGAFTGAERAEPGRVALAAGGTLVLDHIEVLPLSSQPKLLRLLAERRYSPLGGRERSADVRFIAIGADDLEQRVGQGVFRSDLYFRLEVLTYRLPPLRDRLADLETLSEHLLVDLAERLGRRVPVLSRRALDWMQEYPWPGNLRQLRNVLERAMISQGSEQELDPEPPADAEDGKPRTLREVERLEILRALAFTRGHQGRAAVLLGISRKALWEKRKRLGLE